MGGSVPSPKTNSSPLKMGHPKRKRKSLPSPSIFRCFCHVSFREGTFGCFQNRGGPPKSSILIGFSIINHPFWGTPTFWKHQFFFGDRNLIIGSRQLFSLKQWGTPASLGSQAGGEERWFLLAFKIDHTPVNTIKIGLSPLPGCNRHHQDDMTFLGF